MALPTGVAPRGPRRSARPPAEVEVEALEVSAFRIPTEQPESDGTLTWDSTTLVVVEARAGGETGVGYTYEHDAAARLIEAELRPLVEGHDALAVRAAWDRMRAAVRNIGRAGLALRAISAVDTALWDLEARLLGVPLCVLLGPRRESVAAYGSGGFTSYSLDELLAQLTGWADTGLPAVKMKVGRDPRADRERVRAVREALGENCGLFVDANGAYDRKQALSQARAFADEGVTWLEEPVSSDDLASLRLVREGAPAGMEVAAGEYGSEVFDFARMLAAGAVDVLQPDVTRCGGYTGFVRVDALCAAHATPMSAHCAPTLSAQVGCACERLRHVEHFHDHARIERMAFDGALEPRGGRLEPDRRRAGSGLTVLREALEEHRVFGRPGGGPRTV